MLHEIGLKAGVDDGSSKKIEDMHLYFISMGSEL